MSASVDQRMKGQGNQVSNGPKDSVNDEGFDSWRNQPHQSYSTPMSASSMADPYVNNYYGMFPYQNLGLSEGAWSNGDPMTFLGGYSGQMSNDQHSHYTEGMFGGGSFGGFNQPGFNYFPGNGDYSACGSSRSSHAGYDDYYRDMYSGDQSDRSGLKPFEQGMQGLSILDRSDPKMVDVKVPLAKKLRKALEDDQRTKAYKEMKHQLYEVEEMNKLLNSIVETKKAKMDEIERELNKKRQYVTHLEKDVQNLKKINENLKRTKNNKSQEYGTLRCRSNCLEMSNESVLLQSVDTADTYQILRKNILEKDDEILRLKKLIKMMQEQINHLIDEKSHQ